MNHRHRQLAAFDHDLRASAHASQQPGEVASGLPFRNMDHIVHHAAIIPVVRQEPHAPAPKTGHRLGHLDLSFGPGLINIGNGSWKNPGLNLRIQAPVIAENSTAAQSFPKSFPLACPAFLFHELHPIEALLQVLHLLLYLFFSTFGRKEYIVGIFELAFPFLLHSVKATPFVLLVFTERFYQFVIGKSAGVFKFDFVGVQIFRSKESKVLKLFEAQQRSMKRARWVSA